MLAPSGTGTKEHKPEHFECSAEFCPVLHWLLCCWVCPACAQLFSCPQHLCSHVRGIRHQAAPSTWFEFRARLHMVSHFYCQPSQGQDSSSWEGLHWAFTLLPLMPSPPDLHFRFQAWFNRSHRVSAMNGKVGVVADQPGCRTTFLETGWKFLLHASCSKSQIWPRRVNEPWRLRGLFQSVAFQEPVSLLHRPRWEPLLSALPGSSIW